MLKKSVQEFSDILSTKEPVPGGGGASAYVGALGTALGSMVGNLTTGKKKYAEVEDEIQELLGKSETLRGELMELIERDAAAFYPLSQAYGLPKETEEEKAEKERVLQAALVEATMVPLTIAEKSVESLRVMKRYAQIGSRIALSDAGVGAAFCEAAFKGAKLNVLINTRIMKDAALKAEVEEKLAALETEALSLGKETYDMVESYLRV
jgi:formiminotetrahydrofolate cyclodeaminase